MKSILKNKISQFFFAIIILSLSNLHFACNKNKQSKNSATVESNNKVDIPELITRSAKIQLGKEWEGVQKFYAKQQASLNRNPQNNEARLNLIELFVKEARVTGEHGHYYPAALKLANQILSEDSLKKDIIFRTLMTKAGVQLSLHEFNEALQTGLAALKVNDRNAQVYGVLVDAYLELGDYDKAVKMSDKMIGIKPDLRSYSRISYLREVYGDIDGAIKAMEMAIKAGFPGTEETAWAMLTLGDLYNTYKDPETAIKIYKEVLEVRPNYPFAFGALAAVYYNNKDYEKTEATLKKGIDIIPEVGFYMQLAELYKIQGRNKEFEALQPEIIAMLQDDVDNGHNMNLEYVDLYLKLIEDTSKAMEYAKTEFDKRPKNIDTNLAMAKVLHAQNKSKAEIEKYLKIAQKTNSKNTELIALLEIIDNK